MTTLVDLVHETKRHLQSMQREPMNKLNTAIDADDETVTFLYDASQVQTGSYLQIGLELLYVWAVDQSAKTAVVGRGQLGSTASAHSEGDVVTVNPKFPDYAIVKEINNDLRDLSTPANGLYRVRTVELTASATSPGYDLTGATDVLEVLSVTTRHPGAPRSWSPVTNYELNRNAHSDFASGYSFHLADGAHPGQPVRVTYKASFDPLTALTDDVETVSGLPATMHDLPPMGAAVRLVAPREIRRNFIDGQGDSRRAEEVPPGATAASMRALAALRQQRIDAEHGRLAQAYPERQAMPSPVAWL